MKADAYGDSRLNKYYKKQKNRHERRKAKRNPEKPPTYGKYKGWLS